MQSFIFVNFGSLFLPEMGYIVQSFIFVNFDSLFLPEILRCCIDIGYIVQSCSHTDLH